MLTLFEELENSQEHKMTIEKWEEYPLVRTAIHGHTISSQFEDFLSKNRAKVLFPFRDRQFNKNVEEFEQISYHAESLRTDVRLAHRILCNPLYLSLSTGILSGLLAGYSEKFTGNPIDYAMFFGGGLVGGVGISFLAYSVKHEGIKNARKDIEFVDSVIKCYKSK